MGLLRDMLAHKHQSARDKEGQEYDTYASILKDTTGAFGPDQKRDALGRVLALVAPSKKHAEAMTPILSHLAGLGPQGQQDTSQAPVQAGSTSLPYGYNLQTQKDLGVGGIPGAQPGPPAQSLTSLAGQPADISALGGGSDARFPTPNAPPADGGWRSATPQELENNSLVQAGATPPGGAAPGSQPAGGPGAVPPFAPTPDKSQVAKPDSSQASPSSSPVSASGSLPPFQPYQEQGQGERATEPIQSPTRTETKTTPPGSPPPTESAAGSSSPSDLFPIDQRIEGWDAPAGGQGIFNFADTGTRAKVAQNQINMQARAMLAQGMAQGLVGQWVRQQQIDLYHQLKAGGAGDAVALTAAGLKPAGAFAAESRERIAGGTPVPGTAITQGAGGAGFNTRTGERVDLPGVQVPQHAGGATNPRNLVKLKQPGPNGEQYGEIRNGQVVPVAGNFDIQSQDTGQLKQLTDAYRILADPQADGPTKQAAGRLIESSDTQLQQRAVQLLLEQKREMDLEDVDKQAEVIADQIEKGLRPPTTTGLNRTGLAGKIGKILGEHNYDLSGAMQDWDAVQAHIKTMQGPVIQRQVQAIRKVQDTLPLIRSAWSEWTQFGTPTGFSDFNVLALQASARTPGAAGDAARRLMRLTNDLTPELASVYNQGLGVTDHSLAVAATNLQANWNQSQFLGAINDIEKFTKIRENSLTNAGVVGKANRYAPAGIPETGGKFEMKTVDPVVKNALKKDGQSATFDTPDRGKIRVMFQGGKYWEMP